MRFMGNARQTVLDWNSLFRQVCNLAKEKEPKMKGTVRIDEAYFGGKAKYEKGPRLQYDRQSQEPDPNKFITEVLSEIVQMKEKKRTIYRRSMDLGCSESIRMPVLFDL